MIALITLGNFELSMYFRSQHKYLFTSCRNC